MVAQGVLKTGVTNKLTRKEKNIVIFTIILRKNWFHYKSKRYEEIIINSVIIWINYIRVYIYNFGPRLYMPISRVNNL